MGVNFISNKILKTLKFFIVGIPVILFFSACNQSSSIKKIELFPMKLGGVYQYIDRKGKTAIDTTFETATVFRDGLALVQDSGNSKWGFINKKGEYVIPPEYIDATVFSEEIAFVTKYNEMPEAINNKGKVQFSLPKNIETVQIFSEGLAPFSILDENGDNIFGFINKNGEVKIKPNYKKVLNFSEGLCGVSNFDNEWGFIDENGNLIINYKFNETENFKNGKAIVTTDNHEATAVINKKGEYIIKPEKFDNLITDGNLFLISLYNKWGWADNEGKIVINPQYDVALPFNGNQITPVKKNDSYGYINKDGEYKINPQFEGAYPYNGGLALVRNSGKYGLIDKDGIYEIQPKYYNILKDLTSHLKGDRPYYKSVKSDYFDIEPIINILDFENPGGNSFSSTYSEIITKYNLNKSKFDYYNTVILDNGRGGDDRVVIDGIYHRNIDENSAYILSILSPDEKKVYYDDQFSKNVKGFTFLISLYYKGYGKADQVIKAINDMLSEKPYVKDSSIKVYKKNNRRIEIHKSYKKNEIEIYITKIK